MIEHAEQDGRPERVEPANDTDYEAVALLADIDAAEAAELIAYKFARTLERERTRAISRANAYLNNDGAGFFAHEPSARYNPVQKLRRLGRRGRFHRAHIQAFATPLRGVFAVNRTPSEGTGKTGSHALAQLIRERREPPTAIVNVRPGPALLCACRTQCSGLVGVSASSCAGRSVKGA